MANKVFTGNSLLDKLSAGPYVRNPKYNPKTKAGKYQPPVLLDTTPGDINGGGWSNTVDKFRRFQFTGRGLGRTNEEIEEDAELGITLSPYNSEDELNKARANAQSNFTKFGNFLAQAGIGEAIIGSLEGFGNIADGVINSFTGDNYAKNPYTQYMEEVKENFNNNFKIYREDPNANWDLNDFGWWMQNAVSIASTVSLLVPAAGWMKGLGALGKVTKLNKLGNWASNTVSRAIAKGADKIGTSSEFGKLVSKAGKAGRINNAIKSGAEIGTMAYLQRTGENYMEAKAIYDNVYTNSKENLDNMPDSEFSKFITNNPEFENMSKDDIAKEIARKSANKTFWNDYWMLAMDIPQFKALGSLFSGIVKKETSAATRIAAQNVKKQLAGEAEDKLIKNTFKNRLKEDIRYAFKSPLKSVHALELGEGFEELFQGIQSEKGMEIATSYFDPKFTPRTIQSYLTDGSIWEQFFWGAIGGIAFNKIGGAIQKGNKTIKGLYNKKHMTAEAYEQWKRSEDEIAIAKLNNIISATDEFLSNVEKLNSNVNPFKFVKDENTGRVIIKNGSLINETINEKQKELLIDEAVKKFIDDTTLDAIDNGIYDLMKDILSSSEFDKYIANKGLKLTSEDKALAQKIVSRMEAMNGIYKTEINNVNNLADTTNPYITVAVARNIARNKLKLDEYDTEIALADAAINEDNTTGTDYSQYQDKQIYNKIKRELLNIKSKEQQIEEDYKNNKITKAAYESQINNFNRDKKELLNYAAANTTQGAFDSVREALKNDKSTTEDILKEFDDFVNSYNENADNENQNIPTESIIDNIKSKITSGIRRSYTKATIPINQKEYQDIYNEFGFAMDKVIMNKVTDYIERVQNYLRNAEDFDKAVERILKENTGNKKVDEALHYIKFGYKSNNAELSQIEMLKDIQLSETIAAIEKERKSADKRNDEAVEQGVELPIDENTKEQNIDNIPSTGEEIQSEITDSAVETTISTNPIDNTSPVEEEPSGIQTTPDETPIVDTTIPDEENPISNGMTEEELQEQAQIAAGYETADLKATLDASKYVMQIGFKESGRIDDITNSLSNGDTSKYEEFIKEIINFLLTRGYSKKLSEVIAKKAFNNTVASFAAMNNKSTFGKLAQQLAIGFGEEEAKKYSITELIDGNGLNDIIDKFLEEYSNLVGGTQFGDGQHIINIESLFNYIINNEKIDINIASYIYNNIGKFIASHNGDKYIFTGFNTSHELSAEEFFNRLNENKAQVLAAMNKMHINPIEEDQRTKDFSKAVEAAANGAKTYVKLEGTSRKDGNIQLDENKEPIHTHLSIYVDIKKGKKIIPVKIGILRAVNSNSNLTSISPVSHYSGFSNTININNDGTINLDCDVLFNTLINEHDTNESAKQLFNDLIQYRINVHNALFKFHHGLINQGELNKELNKAMSIDMAKRILNNNLIVDILNSGVYKFYKPESRNDIELAKSISNSISSILFYKNAFSTSDPANNNINHIAIDKNTMAERYEQWKQMLYTNYTQTYELQKSIKNENAQVNIDLSVRTYTTLKTIENSEQYINIADDGFDIDKNSPTHTPLVIVTPARHLIDEYGNDYGPAANNSGEFSMGFLINNDGDLPLIAYFNTAQELNGTKLYKLVRSEIADLITKQITNINPDTHDDNFNNIIDKIIELFGDGSLFRFNNGKTKLLVDKDKSFITIAIEHNNKNKTNLLSFFKKNKNGITNSNAIGLYIPRLGKQVPITSLKNTTTKDGIKISEQEIRNALNDAIKNIMSSFKLNRSLSAVRNTTINGTPSLYYRRENGKFILNLAGKDYVYENYGDFILQNRAFNTNIDGSNGSFVNKYIDINNLAIDASVKDKTTMINPKNTFVSDLLFNDKNKDRKTVDTKDVLKAAGVSQDKIDILLGTNSGMPIVTKQIYSDKTDDGKTKAYYNTENKKIYITPLGAASMNGNSMNAIRIILHENLHRLFHRKGSGKDYYNNAERKRILNELQEVREYTLQCIERDKNKFNPKIYNAIIKVLNDANVSDNLQTNMEEFLMETLTQPVLVEYLNNTDYHTEVSIDGIPQKAKSIFQKIIDILLDLLGVKTNRIRNNSILAREYVILSKTDKSTNDGIFEKPINTTTAKPESIDKTISPVEETLIDNKTTTNERLNTVRNKINEVRKGFEKRIVRSPNFKEDHTYLIDGKPADYSVTQKIHGKQDLGAWGIPASLLGNTADDAARIFFENNGHIPESHDIPNVNNDEGNNSRYNLERDISKIKDYLDKRFGRGRYGVITEEFPIGGIINSDGQNKTIAGTMDMLVYTDTGDIYIFDFKTKRLGNTSGEISEHTLNGYKQQVNIYRQLIEANYPELSGKIKTGGLIKFLVDYPAPGQNAEYREHPNVPNQLQFRENKEDEFVNIQDSYADYTAPFFFGDEDFEKFHLIPVEIKDFGDEIKALPELSTLSTNSQIDISGSNMIQNDEADDFIFDDTEFDDIDNDMNDDTYDDILNNITNDEFKATTELIEVDNNIYKASTDLITTATEIYTNPIANGSTDNAYGIAVVNNMNNYINSFPEQYRFNIKQLLADNELNYTCQ